MVARGGGRRPFAVVLTASQRRFLKAVVRRPTAQQRQVTRARIVLLAAAGLANAHIARKLGVAPNTVGKWRKRFCREGVDGLADRKRSGRPRVFGAAVVAYAKAVACELPRTRGVPLGRWSLAELRAELLASGLVSEVSTTTLWRWLAEDPIKPWQHQSWIFPRDPAFAAKAGSCWTCTSAASPVRRWGWVSTSSAPMRRPRFRRAAAAIPPCRRARPA
jgi:transposase